MVRLMKGITQKLLVTDREYRKSGWNRGPYDGVFKIQPGGGRGGETGELHECRGSSKTAFPEKKKKVGAQVYSLCQAHNSRIISSHFKQFSSLRRR